MGMEYAMNEDQSERVVELYDKHRLQVAKYIHKNGTETYHVFYKGRSDNPVEILNLLSKYQGEIHEAIQEGYQRRGDSLESYLSQTHDATYVDTLGSSNGQGIILGAYIPATDKFYVRRDIP